MASRVQQRGRGDDVEVWQWVAALRANGGNVTAQRLMLISRFIAAEKAAGTWQATDDYWALWAENEIQALTSLKQKRLATAVAAPVFTADRGYVSAGAGSYLNTTYNASTHSVAATPGNSRLAVYVRTNTPANSTAIGAVTSTTNGMRLRPRTSTDFVTSQINSTHTTGTASVTSSSGYLCASRNGSAGAVLNVYKNGSFLEAYTPVGFAAAFVAFEIAILGNNVSGVVGELYPPPGQIGFACIGASLTAAQELAHYTNVQAWATAVGAQV